MIQGSNMLGNKGMRKGISLVEMLIAIVLFGVIATMSYVYYKNYYDTAFAAKKLAISVVVDQASQLSNAYDMYSVETGLAPTTIAAMVTSRLLTEAPVTQPAISATGWVLNNTFEVDSGTTATNDTVFIMELDGTASASDKLDYCNILTNKANTAFSIDPAVSTAALTATTATLYTAGVGETEYFHCSSPDAGTTLNLVFVKVTDAL